jgi:PPK2 family polyphosphate:nucleotide phosphotransferase
MNYSEMFLVKPGIKINLSKIDPNFTAGYKSEKSAKNKIKKYNKSMTELQNGLFAEGKWSVLICLQGMDAAGKSGTIAHVLGSMDPQGTRVSGFRVPTAEEAAHDFLWRIEKQAPAKGEVVIFNRSQYEDVLVVRVHKLVPEERWSKRYDFINNYERQLAANNTHILKFFLHISPEEQLKRYRERLDDPAKQWKISEADYKERDFWKQYMAAYEDALSKTSTEHAPWYVIPSNNKWFRDLAVSKIVVEQLKSLGIKIPKPQVDLDEIRRKYHEAKNEEAEGKGPHVEKGPERLHNRKTSIKKDL